MTLSVNTNAGALVALQNLNKTSAEMSVNQQRINTGLAVSSAKDNGAIFAIAQNLRSDLSGLSAVKQSLDRATSTVDVALAAGESISDLLIELKSKAVAASDSSLDTASRTAINDDFVSLRDQIITIVENAEFNGVNAIKNAGKDVTAITNDVGTSSITVAAQDLSLTGTNLAITAATQINTATLASDAVTQLETSITNVNKALATLGTGSRSFTAQRTFTDKLADVIEIGIGSLVDADLAKESAKLQALQVKQQLGAQALAIANQAPGIIVSLFG
ncbi:MAG: flagellin [Sphingomonadales bacterium]